MPHKVTEFRSIWLKVLPGLAKKVIRSFLVFIIFTLCILQLGRPMREAHSIPLPLQTDSVV